MRPPRWTDKNLFKLVRERLEELRGEVEWLDANYEGNWPASEHTEERDAMWTLMMAEVYRPNPWDSERAAVEWALCGYTEPLALLLAEYWGLWHGGGSVKHLSPETCELVLEYVRGVRNPKTGKKRGERDPKTGKKRGLGARRKTPDERRKTTPTYDAVELVKWKVIEAILRAMFPGHKEISERAIELAAEIKGVPHDTLVTHLGRSRTDRRRL
jgi:hypothetical protein